MFNFLELADFAKKGVMPSTGGALDQTKSFVNACRFLWAEESRAEQEAWKGK